MINLLENFLTDYSLPTLIIAIIASILMHIAQKTFKERLNTISKTYYIFIICVILQIVYDIIFIAQNIRIQTDAVVAGAVSGSLSVAISAFIKRIVNGKPMPTTIAGLLIEELIKDYVHESNITQTALYIERLIQNENDEMLESKISLVIKENAVNNISESDALIIAKAILQSEENLG